MNPRTSDSPGTGEAGGIRDQVDAGSSSSLPATGDKATEARYQLLPPLTADEYAALRDSIAADGIRVPIQVDEHGQILDGHHRQQIADELGIDCPRVVVSNLDSEAAKRTVALSLNLSRRHLNREQTRQLIAASLEADPGLSDREHARRCGVSHATVGKVRRHLGVDNLTTSQPPAVSTREEAQRRVDRIGGWFSEWQHTAGEMCAALTAAGMPPAAAAAMVDMAHRDVRDMFERPWDAHLQGERFSARLNGILHVLDSLAEVAE